MHLFVAHHHPQQQAGVFDARLNAAQILAGLGLIEVGHEPDRCAVLDRVQQQLNQALAVMGKTFSIDSTQLRSAHRSHSLGGSAPGFKRQLHKGQVEPAAELDAHLRHLPGGDETQALMQADRGLVAAFDGGDHHVFAAGARAFDQGLHQQWAKAFAALVVAHVHRVLDGVAKAFEGPPVAERGVADHFARASTATRIG